VCLPAPSAARRDSSAAPSIPDTADALVLDHDFIASAGEFVRVFLQANRVYRAELSTPDVTIGIRAPFRRVQLPRVYPVTNASTASGSSVGPTGCFSVWAGIGNPSRHLLEVS
jgi:hypothetical protein